MKRFYTFLTAMLISLLSIAQVPQKISFQAVVRDSDGKLVVEQEVGMKISILQGSADGMEVYSESHSPITNQNGLVSIQIGGQAGFAEINWADGPYFVRTEVDPEGGTDFIISGTNQLLSVPYAFHAKTAEAITSSRYIGELYGGGVVFWVDHTGQHGLIVSMVDLSTAHVWSNISTSIGTTSDWDGANNTAAIIGQTGHTSSAAQLCADYTNSDYGTGTYSDWYLPSIAELNHIWNNFYEVQRALTNDNNPAATPLVKTVYWSSSEYDGRDAWLFFFEPGTAVYNLKVDPAYVRAVRAF